MGVVRSWGLLGSNSQEKTYNYNYHLIAKRGGQQTVCFVRSDAKTEGERHWPRTGLPGLSLRGGRGRRNSKQKKTRAVG